MTHLRPRSISVGDRRTTVRLEDTYWEELKRMSAEGGMTVTQILTAIDATRPGNLSSAIRVFILRSVRASLDHARTAETSGTTRPPNGT